MAQYNDDDLNGFMDKVSLQEERKPFPDQQSNNRRRGINSHLYTKSGSANRGRSNNFSPDTHYSNRQNNRGGGRGRGRARGENHQNIRGQNGDNRNHEFNNKGHPSNNDFTFQPNNDHFNPTLQRHDLIQGNKPQKKKNTETFKPSHKPSDMRITAAFANRETYTKEITSRDVVVVHGLFCEEDDLSIYDRLLEETKECGIDHNTLWQLWHGETHLIADDKTKWKDSCPTFRMVLEKIQCYFNMDIQATRLNWYRDSSEWKPFHHDAAAINPEKAKVQNFTVAVSFGAERDAAFEHATTKTVISLPQPNGSVYTFGKDVNVIWRHGILQLPPDQYFEQGRISVIAWGSVKQTQI